MACPTEPPTTVWTLLWHLATAVLPGSPAALDWAVTELFLKKCVAYPGLTVSVRENFSKSASITKQPSQKGFSQKNCTFQYH